MNISVYVSSFFGEVLTFSLFLMQLLGVFRVLAEREQEIETHWSLYLSSFLLYAIVIIANLLMKCSVKCS